MGITVISSPSAPPASTTSSSVSGGASGGTGVAAGFAALLSGQLGNAVATEAAASGLKSSDGEADDSPPGEAASDPALAFLMALPISAPVQPSRPINFDATQNADADKISGAGNALLGMMDDARSGLKDARLPGNLQDLSGDSILQAKGDPRLSETANIAADTSSNANSQNNALLATGSNAQKAAAETQFKADVGTPLHSANWAQDFSEKVVWLAKNDQQTAQININPPQLGPVQITLQINGDQASAVFASPHAEVRQALEESMPQLKEMLAGAGINLGQADVGANLAQQNREAPFQSANGNRLAGENAILPGIGNPVENSASQPIQRGRGLVDLFA